ncbi:MAG: C39 family peptidase [Chloroflexota bacterium]|nr:C39 family peptidase [Chloroflexota bacterium]MDQ5865709.1 C39 family peptidase [Chloroflexota bacterium]
MFVRSRSGHKLRYLLILVLFSIVAALYRPAVQVEAAADEAMIEGFPSVAQWYNLSCEYAAAAAVTLYWGNLVSQRDFIREIPEHPNPHVGFRGNIHGPHGGIDDYGIYAEPLVPVLEKRGYNAVVFYGPVSRLKGNVAAGNPVVVWLTTGRYEHRPGYYHFYEGERFKLVPYEHAVVIYGYDEGGVYSMDVGDGGFYYTEWDSFLRRWSYFDQMSLVIFPDE